MFYSSDVSDVFLQSIFKLNDEKNKVTSITISESQLVIMAMYNLMIKKKVNLTVPLPQTVVLIYLHMPK